MNVLLIAVIVSLIYGTGFFEEMDNWVNKHWKLCHLPKIIMCPNCATWWLCLIYIIVTGQFNLPMLLLCITMWYLSPLFSNIMYLLIDILNGFLEGFKKLLGL